MCSEILRPIWPCSRRWCGLTSSLFAISAVLLLTGCALTSRYGRYAGVKYVGSIDGSSVSSLVGSRSNPARLLVDSVEVGWGLRLGDSRVFIWDANTGEKRTVAETQGSVIIGQTWSPDGSQVVLKISDSTPGYETHAGLSIWHAEDGSLEFLADKGWAVWSPTGNEIAILDNSDSTGEEVIRFANVADKSEQVAVVGVTGISNTLSADWSPDGTRLVLSIGDPEDSVPPKLFIFDRRDRQLAALTTDGNDFDPAWSPSGKEIAYIQGRSVADSRAVHLIYLDTMCDVSLPHIDGVLSMSWLPGGRQLAFIGPDGVYMLDLETFLSRYVQPASCTRP